MNNVHNVKAQQFSFWIDLCITLDLTMMAMDIHLVSLKKALGKAYKELSERHSIENKLRLVQSVIKYYLNRRTIPF